MKLVALTALSSLFLAHGALGQKSLAATKAKTSAPVTSVANEQPGAADEFHKMLARSNGAWTGQATMTFSPDAPPMTSTSTLTNHMAMGGLYQVSEITYVIMGKSITGVRVTGYDANKKIFTRAMIQDGGNGVAMEGPWDATAKTMTFRYQQLNNATGKAADMKEVYTIIDANTEVLEIYRLDPQTSQESKILNVKWTRNQ
ncbi:DUF1579 family protein [Hymenobacter cavernae]|uniref:DUF1579 domain-containing protein n=1 Tax=Hymenobacter cavernae TaxID=2044852 RepID=A0ABQ1U3C2_9BACT|nr:DUF1579 family protein [Hymenobacter cavernae]GGF09660.1 hypothetical protein GCM10011383_21070 [Hymenobacter cavernae]